MPSENRDTQLRLVRHIVGRELQPAALPTDDEDLAQAGLVDSMTRVNILLAVEEAAGASGLAVEWPEGRAFSVQEIARRLAEFAPGHASSAVNDRAALTSGRNCEVPVKGWAAVPGLLTVSAEQI